MKKSDILKFVCHRRPDRTLSYKNHYFPLCARCTGFYISGFIFLIIFLIINIHYPKYLLVIYVLSLIPLAIDGITQYFGFRESTNLIRVVTGVIAGFGVGLLLSMIIKILFF